VESAGDVEISDECGKASRRMAVGLQWQKGTKDRGKAWVIVKEKCLS